MFLSACALAGLAMPAATAPEPNPAPALTAPAARDHGKLEWFEGTWDQLLAEAKRSNKIVFLDFWASW